MKQNESWWGRRNLFFKAGQGYHVMKITLEGPSSLKVQRMTPNEETRDGVTKTSFYMAPPASTPERNPLIPGYATTKNDARSVSARMALTLCRGTCPV